VSAALKVQESNVIELRPGKWILEKLAYQIWGFTRDQLQKYRADGIMLEGVHYRKNPVGRIVYNVAAVDSWMECK
jgi:hypothetical protein